MSVAFKETIYTINLWIRDLGELQAHSSHI
jgi:hypothetical protein